MFRFVSHLINRADKASRTALKNRTHQISPLGARLYSATQKGAGERFTLAQPRIFAFVTARWE